MQTVGQVVWDLAKRHGVEPYYCRRLQLEFSGVPLDHTLRLQEAGVCDVRNLEQCQNGERLCCRVRSSSCDWTCWRQS